MAFMVVASKDLIAIGQMKFGKNLTNWNLVMVSKRKHVIIVRLRIVYGFMDYFCFVLFCVERGSPPESLYL